MRDSRLGLGLRHRQLLRDRNLEIIFLSDDLIETLHRESLGETLQSSGRIRLYFVVTLRFSFSQSSSDVYIITYN